MQLLEAEDQVLKKLLVLHEEVEGLRKAFDLLHVSVLKAQLGLYLQNLPVLVQYRGEQLDVIELHRRVEPVSSVILVLDVNYLI